MRLFEVIHKQVQKYLSIFENRKVDPRCRDSRRATQELESNLRDSQDRNENLWKSPREKHICANFYSISS